MLVADMVHLSRPEAGDRPASGRTTRSRVSSQGGFADAAGAPREQGLARPDGEAQTPENSSFSPRITTASPSADSTGVSKAFSLTIGNCVRSPCWYWQAPNSLLYSGR